mgnify:CR=1 FL=1
MLVLALTRAELLLRLLRLRLERSLLVLGVLERTLDVFEFDLGALESVSEGRLIGGRRGGKWFDWLVI